MANSENSLILRILIQTIFKPQKKIAQTVAIPPFFPIIDRQSEGVASSHALTLRQHRTNIALTV